MSYPKYNMVKSIIYPVIYIFKDTESLKLASNWCRSTREHGGTAIYVNINLVLNFTVIDLPSSVFLLC